MAGVAGVSGAGRCIKFEMELNNSCAPEESGESEVSLAAWIRITLRVPRAVARSGQQGVLR